MNANAKKWVEALRSGRFKQARKALHRDGGYCCLGVACELYRREVYGTWRGFFFVAEDGRPNKDRLPQSVTTWLGLKGASGTGTLAGAPWSLATHNDDGASFKTIAKLIESEPPGLFA